MRPYRTRMMALVLCAFAMAVFGSCGGSDGSSAQAPSPTTADRTAVTGDTNSGAPSIDGGAVVTVAGTTYDFGADEVRICIVDESGIFRATIANADFTQNLTVSLPPEGYEPDSPLDAADAYPSVDLLVAEAEHWTADAYLSDPTSTSNLNIPEGQTQVDSYRFDSTGASGTATFLDREALTYGAGGATGEPVPGSFEVSCG